jgi:hypothetical protein
MISVNSFWLRAAFSTMNTVLPSGSRNRFFPTSISMVITRINPCILAPPAPFLFYSRIWQKFRPADNRVAI